jgi:hypothetical protein
VFEVVVVECRPSNGNGKLAMFPVMSGRARTRPEAGY